MAMNMAAAHAVNRKLVDPIFEAGQACQAAIKEFGIDKVTNATIGTLLDDAGNLVVLPTVEKVFREMQMAEFTAYAPISGRADYLDYVYRQVFGGTHFEGYFSSVATSGGTGAVHHAIANYAERGDRVLTSDWHWGTYGVICSETGKKLDTFRLFDADYKNFNVNAFSDKVEEILEGQSSLLIILNTPAHNPTGYALTDDEWEKVLNVIRINAAQGNKITLLIDVAYIDFAGDRENAWGFMKNFANLPENVLLLIAYSMSKSYTFYGQRTGALAAFSTNQDVIAEFEQTCKYSSRATWSNINHGAQVLFTKINKNKALRAELAADQKVFRELVSQRAEIFINEAAECGLQIVPYRGGFFIAVPTENAGAVCKKLHEDLIFAVPLKLGIRVAACSTPAQKMSGVAEKMKKAIDAIE